MNRHEVAIELSKILQDTLEEVGSKLCQPLCQITEYGCLVGVGNVNDLNPKQRYMTVVATGDAATALKAWLEEQQAGRAAAHQKAGLPAFVKVAKKEWPA